MKIGDKVRVKSDYSEVTSNAYSRRGETGTILGFNNIVIPDLHITYVKFDSDNKFSNVFTSALELIEDKQNNMEKEIIGYLSPISIGLNSKGTLYTAYRGNAGLYIPELTKDETHRAYYSVPKEIVETSWEPVYKKDQTKTLVLGTGRIKVVISNGVVVVDGENVIVYKDLLNVYRIMTDNNTQITGSGTSYTVSFPKGVKIGCSEFEISEIEQIINTYNELNK
jgi:hypothetical protein